MKQNLLRLRRRLLGIAIGSSAALLAPAALAQPSAQPPIRLINGFAAGGSTDVVTRLLADKLRAQLGRPVIVENKVGAGGQLAIIDVKNAAPDGTTLLVTPSSPVSLYPLTYRNLSYAPLQDLSAIARITSFDFAVTAGPGVPARTVVELIDWLKHNPSKAHYGTAGAGTLLHFVGLRLGNAAGVELTHVPYKGGSAALVDLLGGNVSLMVDSPMPTIEAHRQGKLRILAVTGPARSAELPEVPTLRESGVDFTAESYIGVFGPAGLPENVVQSLNAAIVATVNTPEFRDQVRKLGMNAAPSSPRALRDLLVQDGKEWGPIVRQSGFTSDK